MDNKLTVGSLVKKTQQCEHHTWISDTAVGRVNRILDLHRPLYEVIIQGQVCLFSDHEIRKVG